MIEAVIFDMDGVIIDSEHLWRKAEKKVFAQLGIELDEELGWQASGLDAKETVEYWMRHYAADGHDVAQAAKEIEVEAAQLMVSEGKAKEGVRRVLDFLKNKNLRIGLASSAPQFLIEAIVKHLEIESYFEILHSSEHEIAGKPHPAVYLSTAAQLGVAPARCLAFEDSMYGVQSAKNAGMSCVAIPYPQLASKDGFSIADAKISSFREFTPQLFDQLNNK